MYFAVSLKCINNILCTNYFCFFEGVTVKKFMQIDRRIVVNGISYLVRCEEKPNGEWYVFDLDRKFNISTRNKETAFTEWETEAATRNG